MARTNGETRVCTRVAGETESSKNAVQAHDSRRTVDLGTQTDISISGEGKWIDYDPAEEEIDPFVFSDDDIDLTEGEVKAILKQQIVPDTEGSMECNPDEVELCAMDLKTRRYRLKRSLSGDSGAGDPVIPRRMVNAKKIRPSAGSRRGLHYVSATDHRILNIDEIDLEIQEDEGHNECIVFQVADVNKSLMSMSD